MLHRRSRPALAKRLGLALGSWGIVLSGLAQEEILPPPIPPHHLVNVNVITPRLLEEIRYATAFNFTGKELYPFPAAIVHRDVATALQNVQTELATEGLGLKIFDGYRPLSIQFAMWQAVPDPRYVSDPAKSQGKHTRGTAVDVTLIDSLGNELEMPTPYDDFTVRAHRDPRNWTPAARKNVAKLEAVMEKHGFESFFYEWWHYDFKDWKSYPPLDVSFDVLQPPSNPQTPATTP